MQPVDLALVLVDALQVNADHDAVLQRDQIVAFYGQIFKILRFQRQGDQAACSKPPVDIYVKVVF